MTLIRRLILTLALMAGLSPAFAQVPAPVPALPDSERRTSYSISGTTCVCSVGFALYGDSTDFNNWVEVFINGVRYDYNDASHGWTITSPSGSLSTLARPITNAVLTFNAVQTGTVQIVGARRPRRTAQFSESAGVSARNLNQVFTDIISQNREIWDKNNDMTGRGLFSQPGNTVGPLPLPSACSGKFLGFDITGLIPQCNTGGPGSGNVVGPGSSTDGDFALFNGASGAIIKDAPSTVIQNATANRVWAGPTSGGAAAPAFRALVGADLPNPGASSLGGVQSVTCSASNWFNTLSTGGVFGCSQPNFTDLAGSIAAGQIPAGVVALTKLATQSANTGVCNATGGAASPTECSKTQLTALINTATAALSGALPAWPNNTTTYLRGDGTYVTHNCAAVTDASVYCSATRGQLPGETTTGSATAGNVGEYIESVIATGSATSLTSGAAKTITSISLTAGDWDVSGNISYNTTGSASITFLEQSLSLSTNTVDLTAGRNSQLSMAAVTSNSSPAMSLPVGPHRFSLSGTTSVFLVSQQTFSVGSVAGWGIIRARRVR